MAASGVFPKSVGDRVTALDYNTVQTLIKDVKTDYYGLATTSTQVASGTTITAAHWNKITQDINACIKHQTGSETSLTYKSAGDKIRAGDINAIWGGAAAARTNQANVYELTQIAGPYYGTMSVRDGTSAPWNKLIYHTINVTWANAAAADYFFNQGGFFRITASASGGVNSKDVSWTRVINQVQNYTGPHINYNTGVTTADTRTVHGNKPGIIFDKWNWAQGPNQRLCYISGQTTGYYGYGYGYGYGGQNYNKNSYYILSDRLSANTLRIRVILEDNATLPSDTGVYLRITSRIDYHKSFDAIPCPAGYLPTFTTTHNF